MRLSEGCRGLSQQSELDGQAWVKGRNRARKNFPWASLAGGMARWERGRRCGRPGDETGAPAKQRGPRWEPLCQVRGSTRFAKGEEDTALSLEQTCRPGEEMRKATINDGGRRPWLGQGVAAAWEWRRMRETESYGLILPWEGKACSHTRTPTHSCLPPALRSAPRPSPRAPASPMPGSPACPPLPPLPLSLKGSAASSCAVLQH